MTIRPRLFSLYIALATLGAVACSKDPAGPQNQPANTPASLAIQAGNGQTAAVSTPVPINPAVVVRNAQNAPVAGVRVNFSVDEGGGAIGVAGVFTDENGIASAGQWTLGATPGTQALGAVIHNNSSIAKVTITATAEAEDDVIVTQTVTAAGGTLTVNRPGTPLHGVSLQIDEGALAGPAAITLLEVPTTGLTIPEGMQALSPGLGIASSVGQLQGSALVTFPATPVAGKVLMVAVGNPATGAITVLPAVSSNASSITALLPALDSRTVPAVAADGVAGEGEEPTSIPFLIGINEERLQVPFNSGFEPGVDDWDFPPMGIAKLPFLPPQETGLGSFPVNADGMVATAIWYHANRRKAGAPPLNGLTQEAPGQPLSSVQGIRWTALAEANVPSFNQVGSLAAEKWDDMFTDDAARFAQLQFLAIKALFLTTFERPVPVVLLTTDDPDEFNVDAAPLAIAYRAEGNTLYLAIPFDPGRVFTVTISEQGMTPFTLQTPNGALMTVKAVAGVHYVNVVDDAKLAAQWTKVAAGTIGDAEGWPKAKLHWEKAELDTARVYLLDELRHWWECAECPDLVPTPANLPATASNVQRVRFGKFTGNQIGSLSAGLTASMNFSAALEELQNQNEVKAGYVVYHPLATDVELGIAAGWLDWITTTYRKLELEPSVASIEFSQDTTITVTVTPSEAPPAGTKYRWLLRTADSQDSVETVNPTHTRDLEAGTEGWLIFSALEGEDKRPIARDSIQISVAEAVPYWRLTSFADQDTFLSDDISGEGPILEMIQRLLASPGSGLLAIDPATAGSTQLNLRVLKAGVWTDVACCPPPPTGANEILQVLGTDPPVPQVVGPFFAGWNSDYWTQSTPDLLSGTLSAQQTLDIQSRAIKDLGTQLGPGGGFRLQATRNGTNMVGVLTLTVWWVDDESGEIEEPGEEYRFPFSAVALSNTPGLPGFLSPANVLLRQPARPVYPPGANKWIRRKK